MMQENIHAERVVKKSEAISWKRKVRVIVFLTSALYFNNIMMQNHCLSGSVFNFKGYPNFMWPIIWFVLISFQKKESASIPSHSGPFISSMLGETVKLWCNATGYPKPTVTWYAYQQTGSVEKLESKPSV